MYTPPSRLRVENPSPVMVGCPVVALWGVSQHGQYPGEGRLQNLRACLDSPPIKDSDAVVGEIECLCAEYERIAFTAGLKLMAQLMLKLMGDDN